jgi:hypothetical protein
MPLLRKNNRERAVGIVKAVMTQQAVATTLMCLE